MAVRVFRSPMPVLPPLPVTVQLQGVLGSLEPRPQAQRARLIGPYSLGTGSETADGRCSVSSVRYMRLYAGPDRESHFGEVEVPLHAVDFAPPAPPLNLSSYVPAEPLAFASAAPGWQGDWHCAPRRQFAFYAGEVETEASDGEIRHLGPGSVILVEDTTGKGHRSRVVGFGGFVVIVQLPD